MSEARLYSSLGIEMKNIRKHHQVTQLRMSIYLNISRTSLSYIENGKQRPPLYTYYKAFAYFDELETLCRIIRSNDL